MEAAFIYKLEMENHLLGWAEAMLPVWLWRNQRKAFLLLHVEIHSLPTQPEVRMVDLASS